mgnify:CR=1 FL=1
MLLLLAAALAAPPPAGRYLVATEVLMPEAKWFNDAGGTFGFETRSWQLRAVLRCTPQEAKGKRALVRCAVEDAALQASAFQRSADDDPKEAEAVLQELLGRLRGYALEAELTDDGRVKRWDSVDRPEGSLRETDTGWLLELMVERAVAGLWLESPEPPFTVGQQFVEYDKNPLYVFPRVDGAFPQGTAQVLHQVTAVGDTVVVVDSVVEGTAAVVGQLRVRGRSREWLGVDGALQRRTWSVDADLQDVTKYHHAGWIRELADGVKVDLGPVRQVRAPGDGPEKDLPGLPGWPGLGEPPP